MSDFFFDFEFYDDGRSIHPISVGIVDTDGGEFYEEYQFDWSIVPPDDWIQDNVRKHLSKSDSDLLSRGEVADGIEKFINLRQARFWGYYPSYDWVCFCQTFGSAQNLPPNVSFLCMDLEQYYRLIKAPINTKPPKPENAHNALVDARWNLWFWKNLRNADPSAPRYDYQPTYVQR